MYQIKKKVGGNVVTLHYDTQQQALGAVALYVDRYGVHAQIELVGSRHRDKWVEPEPTPEQLEQPAEQLEQPAEQLEQPAEQLEQPAQQEKPKRGRPKKTAETAGQPTE